MKKYNEKEQKVIRYLVAKYINHDFSFDQEQVALDNGLNTREFNHICAHFLTDGILATRKSNFTGVITMFVAPAVCEAVHQIDRYPVKQVSWWKRFVSVFGR